MNQTASHWLMLGILLGAILAGLFYAWRDGLLG